MPHKLTQQLCAPLIEWYEANKRELPWRENRQAYRVWVSEIMLQQTRVEAVRGYYARFMQALPTIQDLAQASEEQYLKLWEGLGYYSRVRNMHRAAMQVCEQYGGVLPSDYQSLLKLPGIGDYTAGAVASIAYGTRVPAVDGNVLRVVSRLTADTRAITDAKTKADMRAQVEAILPADPSAFNQAMMELGALICVPNGAPKCGQCPVRHLCEGAESGIAVTLPVKAAKKQRQICHRTVFLLRYENLVALHKRPETGLLAKLWEFPATQEALSPAQAQVYLQERGYAVQQMRSLRKAKHIFTHIEWHMTGYYVDLKHIPNDDALVFVTLSQLWEQYALPSAFRAFAKVLEGNDAVRNGTS